MRTFALIGLCAIATICFAAGENAYFIAGEWDSPAVSCGYSLLRDATKAAQGEQLIIKVRTPNPWNNLPSTNDANNYALSDDGEVSYVSENAFVGWANEPDPAGTPGPIEGEYYCCVTGAATEGYAYLHIFSSDFATNSAYVCETPPVQMDGSTDQNIGTMCDNLNPCYKGLVFECGPFTYVDGDAHCISGSMNTVDGGANNTLADTTVMVYWRTNEGAGFSAWQPLGDFYCYNGGFTGTYPGGSQFMIGMAGGDPDALPNSSFNPVVPVPEPVGQAVVCVLLGVLARRRR